MRRFWISSLLIICAYRFCCGTNSNATLYEPNSNCSQYDELQVNWKRKRLYPNEKRVIFSGDVKVVYLNSVVKADEVILDFEKKEGFAIGNVNFQHPEGSLAAQKLRFNWRSKSGFAEDVSLIFYGTHIKAKTIDISPEQWKIKEAHAICEPSSIVQLGSKDILITSGELVEIHQPKFKLLNRFDIALPKLSIKTSSEENHPGYPKLAYRRHAGFGIAYDKAIYFENRMGVNLKSLWLRKRPMAVSLASAWNLNPNESKYVSFVRSDLRGSFSPSYLDGLFVESFEDEFHNLGKPRKIIGISTSHNKRTSGRLKNAYVSKPYEIALETSNNLNNLAYRFQARYQKVAPQKENGIHRAVVSGTASTHPLNITDNLSVRVFALGSGFFSEKNTYGWGRIQAGISFCPIENVKLSTGYSKGKTFGTFQYKFDQPYSLSTLHFRGEWSLKNTKLTYLTKYDIPRKEWLDHQFSIKFRSGAFEPYIYWSKRSGRWGYGIELAASKAIKRLQSF
jgi:hypothetical protein